VVDLPSITRLVQPIFVVATLLLTGQKYLCLVRGRRGRAAARSLSVVRGVSP
jgi:hypothetical protein